MTVVESKLKNIGTSIFAVMTKLANEKNALNLSQGFPDFDISPELIELVNNFMKAGKNQYAPMPGWMPLREALSDKIDHIYGTSVNPDTEITITPGGTYAIYTALTTILKPARNAAFPGKTAAGQ